MKNIDLTRGNFPTRLRELREEHHLSQSDLAEKTGLTYRTIHDIEKGRRARVQEKTLMLIAEALGMSVEELLNGDAAANAPSSAGGSSQAAAWVRVGIAVALVAIVTLGVLWKIGLDRASWSLEGQHLTGYHGVFGVEIWDTAPGVQVVHCEEAPWGRGQLLLSLNRESDSGGALVCVDRASGREMWSVRPDIDALVAAFGKEDVLAADFSCLTYGYPDVDGDGTPEVLVRFTHGLYYPTAVCLVDSRGHRRSQYATKGHVLALEYEDIDADGKDEVIGSGTNNAKAYQGAMVFILDDAHASGASIDENCDPWSDQPDSALVRVVLPQYPEPYMDVFDDTRLSGWEIQVFRNRQDDVRLHVKVAGKDPSQAMIVHLDTDLNPLAAEPTDYFSETGIAGLPDSLKVGTGPGDPVWRAEWLAEHKRFEAGHWPRERRPD